MSRQLYLPEGIDVQKVLANAQKTSDRGPEVVVHFHSKAYKCKDYRHKMYMHGEQVDEWGEKDGSSGPNYIP
jgi:hypothetical protein